MGGLVEHNLRAFDDHADFPGTAVPDTYSRSPHSEKTAVFHRCMPDDRPQLSAVWDGVANAHLSTGIHGLQRVEGWTRDVSAVGRRHHINDISRPSCARRL